MTTFNNAPQVAWGVPPGRGIGNSGRHEHMAFDGRGRVGQLSRMPPSADLRARRAIGMRWPARCGNAPAA